MRHVLISEIYASPLRDDDYVGSSAEEEEEDIEDFLASDSDEGSLAPERASLKRKNTMPSEEENIVGAVEKNPEGSATLKGEQLLKRTKRSSKKMTLLVEDFLEQAQHIPIKIATPHGCQIFLKATPRQFKSGSFGWSGSGEKLKVSVKIHDPNRQSLSLAKEKLLQLASQSIWYQRFFHALTS